MRLRSGSLILERTKVLTASSSGLAPLCSQHSGWGVGWRDFDNDGTKELFAARGHVLDTIERERPGVAYKETPFLAKIMGGKLRQVPLPGAEPARGGG